MNCQANNKTALPKVSVIVLSYNGEQHLEACLSSVLDQTLAKELYEVIVADNASSDDSAQLVENKFKSVKLVRFSKNAGFAAGNNKALPYCKGDYIVLLNQDTVVHRNWLEALLNAAAGGKQYGALQSNILMPRNEGFDGMQREHLLPRVYYYDLDRFGHVEQSYRDLSDEIIQTGFVSGASVLLRRKVLAELGYLFDSTLGNYGEDLDLSLRLIRAGFKLGTVPSSIVYHKSGFSFEMNKYNVWKNYVMTRNRLIVFWKNYSLFEFIRKLPFLLCSQPIKIFRRAGTMGKGKAVSSLLSLASIPCVIAAFLGAILQNSAAYEHGRTPLR